MRKVWIVYGSFCGYVPDEDDYELGNWTVAVYDDEQAAIQHHRLVEEYWEKVLDVPEFRESSIQERHKFWKDNPWDNNPPETRSRTCPTYRIEQGVLYSHPDQFQGES